MLIYMESTADIDTDNDVEVKPPEPQTKMEEVNDRQACMLICL